jgi:hypothetical protein
MLQRVPDGAELGYYGQVACEVLRALRGARSQRALARRLGYKSNPIADWEHARRVPTAQEALRTAGKVGVDVVSAFARFHLAPLPALRGHFQLAAWMNAARGSTPVARIAPRVGVSRFALRRWLRGEAEPRFTDFMRYVDATTGRLYDLVAALVPIERVPSLLSRYEAANATRRAAYEAPWTEAVIRVLETEAYSQRAAPHEPGEIARMLKIDALHEERALRLLLQGDVIFQVEGRYKLSANGSVDTRGDRARVNALLSHWLETARQRVQERNEADFFAYSLAGLSRPNVDAAREILRRAFREIRALAATAQPCDDVVLMNLQLLPLLRSD